MRLSCALTCCAACRSAGCSGSLVNAVLYCGCEKCAGRGGCDWENWGWMSCWSNECTLVVEARDSGRLLLVDMDVFDRDRRMSVAIASEPGWQMMFSVYTKTNGWQRDQMHAEASEKVPEYVQEAFGSSAESTLPMFRVLWADVESR